MAYRLFYLSRCIIREQFDAKNIVDQIANEAAVNNGKRNITGALTFDGNDFAQILEGEQSDVLKLFEKIKSDKRHHNIQIIKEQNNITRHYAQWGMKKLDSSNYDELVRVMS